MDPDSFSKTLARFLADHTIAANADTIVRSPNSTIIPSQGAAGQGSHIMDELVAASSGDFAAKLRVEGFLGEGGMGVVRLAEQRSLGRKIALKSLKPGVRDEGAVQKLLHEAFITGQVQHPSVVPIHDIVIDGNGLPAIVLQRIEGQSWEALMFDERSVKRRFGADDLLEWNLQILAQVTQAIAYAHSRGIIHRDLKPENVMIGEFGQVYVVDWGLAVSIGPDEDPRLPRLRETEHMAGTPAYMAPEMLGGRNVLIGRATDVYLLGAILYEIVAGMPPHSGETLQEIIGNIVLSQPRLPGHVPEELARIVRRAMDPDPHARFENVVQLRLAIQGFIKHQGSRRLAEEADRRRVAIDATLAAYARGEKIDETTLQATYAECRFSYEQALRGWPDNEAARSALDALVLRVTEFELGRGQPRVARSMIAGYEESLPELASRIDVAVREKDRELAKLEALGRELNPETGRRTRAFLAGIVGSMWAVAPHLRVFPAFARIPDSEALVLLPMLFLGIGTVLFLWARESMTKTAINRFLAVYVGMVLFTQILLAWAMLGLGIDALVTYRLCFLLWALAAATIALIAQLRMLIASVGYLVGFFIVMRYPEHRLWVSSVGHLITTLISIIIWAPSVGPVRVLDSLDPRRNESMATFRVVRPPRDDE